MTDCNAGLSLNTVLPTTTGSSQPFTLNASDDYLLCVRAVRTTGTAPNELTLRSDWVSAPSKPEPPARAHISNRTTSSLTLSWDEVVGLSYQVRIDGDAEFTPDTNGSHRFGGLVRRYATRLGSQRSTGDARLRLELRIRDDIDDEAAARLSLAAAYAARR